MFKWFKKSEKQEEGLIKDYNNMIDAINEYVSKSVGSTELGLEDLVDMSNYAKTLNATDAFALRYIEDFVELKKRQEEIKAEQETIISQLSKIESLLDILMYR